MNRILRRIVVPSLAVVGVLVALPSSAHADEHGRGESSRIAPDRDRSRLERERHERAERERERERMERLERERREHQYRLQLACTRAYQSGEPAWRLREMGCYVR